MGIFSAFQRKDPNHKHKQLDSTKFYRVIIIFEELFESVGWLFKSYLVIFKSFLYFLKN